MARPRNKVSAASPSDSPQRTPSTGVASLVATVMSGLRDVFSSMDWAEDEIERAARRHPDQTDALYHSFGLLQPRDIGPGMGGEFVYRSHAAELLDRVAAGVDTRPATAAELCLVCCEASLRTPLDGPTAGMYFRMWLQAFPDTPITAGQADQQVHYERLYGTQIDDLERTQRHKAADPHRRLQDVNCPGTHHGVPVACRYATTPPGPAPATLDNRRATR